MRVAQLAFEDVGAGPVVVLIHGHPFDRSMWGPQQSALVDAGFRVITPDLRGYGASPVTLGTVTMAELAHDVLGLLDHLEVERAAIVGLSMGGLVAMELAIRSDRLWALGLAATTAQPVTDEERARRLGLAGAAEREGMAPLIAAMDDVCGPRCPPEVIEFVEQMMRSANPRGAAAALRGRAERPDYRPRLRAVSVPTFVCAGGADRFSTASVTQELLDCLPNATTLLLSDVGHMPNLEAPAEFNQGLVAFLLAAENRDRGASSATRS